MFSRTFGLEDISIRSGPGNEDGRTVEAYAAVFDVPTRIDDWDGEYEEVLDRSAFSKAISDARPTGSRKSWRCGVFYNHGKTLYGTASERHSEPIGVCLDIQADARGLRTVTRYHRSADNILEAIREGSISAYSFSGAFMRSDPMSAGKHRPDSTGRLRTVRRLESTLREYGPTPFPAYADAEIVGMRAEQADPFVASLTPDQRARLIELLTGDGEPTNVGTPDPGAVTGEPLIEHPTRHHAHALYVLTGKAKYERAGIVLPDRGAKEDPQ